MGRSATRLILVVAMGVALSGCLNESTGPCTPASSPLFAQPWDELTDVQLTLEIQAACGHVFVGFKESNQDRGVSDQGQNRTSAETVQRMHHFLLARGFVIERSFDMPAVSGRMPARSELVTELRRHANVDYLEPIFPGRRS